MAVIKGWCCRRCGTALGSVRNGDLYLNGYAVQSASAICPNCGQKRRWVPLRRNWAAQTPTTARNRVQ